MSYRCLIMLRPLIAGGRGLKRAHQLLNPRRHALRPPSLGGLICGVGAGLMQEVAQTATYYIEGLNNYQMISDGLNQMSMAAYLSQWTTIGASGACYAILLGFWHDFS